MKECFNHSFEKIQCSKIGASEFCPSLLPVINSMHILKMYAPRPTSSEFHWILPPLNVHWTARCCEVSITIRQSRVVHLPCIRCKDLGRDNHSTYSSVKWGHCHSLPKGWNLPVNLVKLCVWSTVPSARRAVGDQFVLVFLPWPTRNIKDTQRS